MEERKKTGSFVLLKDHHPSPHHHHQPIVASSHPHPHTHRMARTSQSTVLLRGALQRVEKAGTNVGSNLIAYSGGVDSSLVAALVHKVFPDNSFACVGKS